MFGGRSHEPPTNQVPMLYAFNTTICPTVGLTYHTRLISEATARDIATAMTVTSAIGRMRQELVDRLLVQISEHGLQVHCGYGERDG